MDDLVRQTSQQVVTKKRLRELVDQIDPNEQIDPEVEAVLLELADDFIGNVTRMACQMSRHRQSDTLEVKDLQMVLESSYGIRVPGFSAGDEAKPVRKSTVPAAHQQRLNQVKKAAATDLGEKEKEKNARKQSRS